MDFSDYLNFQNFQNRGGWGQPAAPAAPPPPPKDPYVAPKAGGSAPIIDPGTFEGSDLHTTIGKILGEGSNYANWITATEGKRYDESLDNTKTGAAAFDKPSLTDRDIARQYSGASDKAASAFRGNIGALRSQLGQSGQTGGGFSAGLAARYESNRQASLTDATRSLYEKRIDSDMNDRMARWQANQAVSSSIARDPSIAGLDWLGTAGTMALGEKGIDAQSASAAAAAKASKKSGKMSAGGNIISSAIGAIA